MLPRDQTEPRCHVTAVLEVASVTDGGNYRGSDFRPDTPNAGHSAAGVALAEDMVDASVELVDASVDLMQERKKASEDLAAEIGQVIVLVGDDLRNEPAGAADRFGESDAAIEQDASHLADQRGAVVYQAPTRAVERLDILLFDRLLWHEPHIRLAKRSANRLGVITVVLLVLDERLHVLRRNDLNLVSKRLEPALPKVRPGAGLDADSARLKRGYNLQESFTPDAPLQYAISVGIGAPELEYVLGQVDPQ
jgi:hypothetical protein